MPKFSLMDILRGGFAPTDLYQLPTRQVTFNEDDGPSIIFSKYVLMCIDFEIENLDTVNPMTYTVDSLDSAIITLGVGVSKSHSRTITRSIHVKSANPDYVIIAAVVDIFQAAKIPGIEI